MTELHPRQPSLAQKMFASATILSASLCVAPPSAQAGGLYLLDRGSRSLSMGGAQVASVNDPGALWYNPAGLSYTTPQFQADGTLSFLGVEFSRIDDGGQRLPTVHGESLPLPIPTLGIAIDPGIRNMRFAATIMAPNAVATTWPTANNAPQRYSLYDMAGSAFAFIGVGASWRPIPQLSVGAGIHLVTGAFGSTLALSACDGAICTYPESTEYDATTKLSLPFFLNAMGTFGAILDLEKIRIGISAVTPFTLSGTADIQVRPPSAAAYDGSFTRNRYDACANVSNAEIEGDPSHPCRKTQADLSIPFPWILRVGAALTIDPSWTAELAVVYETWSMQQTIDASPRSVYIANALGFLDYEVGNIQHRRNMSDVVSVRAGGEWHIDQSFSVRAGAYFETSAFSSAYTQIFTVDSDKIVASAGITYRIASDIALDASVGYAHLFARDVRNSNVPSLNPIRPSNRENYIGNGDYRYTLPFFGLGLRVAMPGESFVPAHLVPATEGPATEREAESTDLERNGANGEIPNGWTPNDEAPTSQPGDGSTSTSNERSNEAR